MNPTLSTRPWNGDHVAARRMQPVLRIMFAALIAMMLASTIFTGTASAAGLGLQLVKADSAFNSSPKSVTATCPTGKKLVGAGAQVNSPSGLVRVHAVRPIADAAGVPFEVEAIAAELGAGTTENWQVSAFATCANASALPGLQLVQVNSPSNSTDAKTVFASCPTSQGKRALATGAQILGASAGSRVALVELNTNTQSAETRAVEAISTSSDWQLQAFAICAHSSALPFASLQEVTESTPLTGLSSAKAFAQCPTGKKLLSANARINTDPGEAIMDEMTFMPDLSGVNVVGIKLGGASGFYSVRAEARCVTP